MSGNLTEQDLQYAQDLLDWSRGLDAEKILWEDWEKRNCFKRNIEEGE